MKKVKICPLCGENTIGKHLYFLVVDYFVIGDIPPALSKQETSILDEKSSLSSKIVFIEITDSSLKVLEKIPLNSHQNTKYFYFSKIEKDFDIEKWQTYLNRFSPYAFFKFSESDLTDEINAAKKEIREIDQAKDLAKLKQDNLSDAQERLEQLEESNKKLLKARQRTLQSKKNELLNLNCIEVIFSSESISELEEKLSELLSKSLSVVWIRILTNVAEVLTDLPTIQYQNQFETLMYDIDIDRKMNGKIIFAKKLGKKFRKDEVNLCQNISDALSLKVKQITTEQKIKNIRQQWDTTFSAIPFKAALISKDYDVIKIGGQFENKEIPPNIKCYKLFWGKDSPCAKCKLGDNFLIDHMNESLEVNSKRIFDPATEENFFLNFYRDFDVSNHAESNQAALSKLEELGLICGSIAHELNNPLGGINILLDLIKEDPDAQSKEDQTDIKILKDSTTHCISTVRELLKFTRKQKSDSETNFLIENLNQVKVFTRAFLQSNGFELEILTSPLLQIEILAKNSTLTIRLLEMVSQFISELSEQKVNSRKVYLDCELLDSELKISLSTQKPESRQDPPQFPKTPLYLDPTKVVQRLSSNQGRMAILSFQI